VGKSIKGDYNGRAFHVDAVLTSGVFCSSELCKELVQSN